MIFNVNKNFLIIMGYIFDEVKGYYYSMFVEFSFKLSLDYLVFW